MVGRRRAVGMAVLMRTNGVTGMVLLTARHLEIARQLRLLFVKREAGRLAAEQLDMVGDLVIEGEVAHSHIVQAGLFLQRPVARAKLLASLFQRGFRHFAAPVAFQRKFQFAFRADTGKTKNVGVYAHDVIEI